MVALVVLFATLNVGAASSPASSLILYRSPSSATHGVVQLWTTNGNGLGAQELVSLKPVVGSEALRAAYLVPGGLILAVRDPADGNVSDVAFLRRGSHELRRLFSVRGLSSLRPSPDGTEIAYSRSLPVGGKPLLLVARRDGTIVRTLAHATSKSLSWSSDGRRVFAYGVTPDCWFCVFSVATGGHVAITEINLDNLWGGWPSVSPTGTRVAFPDAKGPAGERIYTTKGTVLRNLVGGAAPSAFWSPDEERLLLQPQTGIARMFSFKSKRLSAFAHDGPANLVVLDWQ